MRIARVIKNHPIQIGVALMTGFGIGLMYEAYRTRDDFPPRQPLGELRSIDAPRLPVDIGPGLVQSKEESPSEPPPKLRDMAP